MVNSTMRNLTAADVLRANRGIGPGFDALRLGLAVWVFTLHAAYICRGVEGVRALAANPLHGILLTPVLPMFFLVSGYLVTGSAIRTRALSTFLLFRIFRILPALFVEVTLSALVLGPWLTEKSLSEYFSNPNLYKYFLNIIGRAHFFLPGLFLKNPFPFVNVNLWTLRPEFYCYIFMAIMILSGVVFSKRNFTIVCALTVVATFIYELHGGQLYNFLGLADWKMLILAFILGCLAYHWNDWFIISKRNALIALLIASAAFMYPPMIMIGFLMLIYIVIYIGAQKIYLPGFLRRGDYSYGIYLFGFPIQQTLVYFLPVEYRHGINILVLGLPLTLGFAMLSWNFVEKPTLKLKNRFKAGGGSARLPLDLWFKRTKAGAPTKSADSAIMMFGRVRVARVVNDLPKTVEIARSVSVMDLHTPKSVLKLSSSKTES